MFAINLLGVTFLIRQKIGHLLLGARAPSCMRLGNVVRALGFGSQMDVRMELSVAIAIRAQKVKLRIGRRSSIGQWHKVFCNPHTSKATAN
jgi:hypothetical protein